MSARLPRLLRLMLPAVICYGIIAINNRFPLTRLSRKKFIYGELMYVELSKSFDWGSFDEGVTRY